MNTRNNNDTPKVIYGPRGEILSGTVVIEEQSQVMSLITELARLLNAS